MPSVTCLSWLSLLLLHLYFQKLLQFQNLRRVGEELLNPKEAPLHTVPPTLDVCNSRLEVLHLNN